ncbi:MAG: translation initiation factor IF-3 [Fibromonadaceae bacterium]|jgi:translation initiation factor IF-3|nr:translation initiation factor IF-3 [Fibromonadaceae bacterium]
MLQLRGRPQPNRPKDGIRINQEIRVPQVRLIDAKGAQVGVIDAQRALQMARDIGLDLVEISPNANPPVCKIIDYGKYRFDQAKKQKAAKAHQQATGQMKEIKLHFQTATNDYRYRMVQAQEFLEKGFKVKVLVQFRGRELSRMEFGHPLIDQARVDLAPFGDIEELKVDKCFAIAVTPRKGGKKKETNKPANESVKPISEQAKHETEQKAAGEALTGGNPAS